MNEYYLDAYGWILNISFVQRLQKFQNFVSCYLKIFKWNLNQNHNTLYCESYHVSNCETISLGSFKADGFNWKQAFKYFTTNYLIIIIKSTFVALFRLSLIQFTTNSFFIQLYTYIYNIFECAYCTSICKNKKSIKWINFFTFYISLTCWSLCHSNLVTAFCRGPVIHNWVTLFFVQFTQDFTICNNFIFNTSI